MKVPIPWIVTPLPTCLAAARVLCLREEEAYWVESSADFIEPINPRNEAAALSLLLANRQQVCAPKDAPRQEALLVLSEGYDALCPSSLSHSPSSTLERFSDDTPEARLQSWATQQGVRSCVSAATFGGGLRGAVADDDIQAGDCVMSVPASMLINYQTARESDFGKALCQLPDLGDETIAVIWTMVDRHDDESTHTAFWSSLPSAIGTGLSADDEDIRLLEVQSMAVLVLHCGVHLFNFGFLTVLSA